MPGTAVLPLPVPPTTGGYTLRRDRCVVELSVRLLRVPMLRGRLAATGGQWTPGSTLEVTLDPASLRTKVPFLSFAGPEITFAAEDLADRPLAAGEPFVVEGRVAGREARLRGDVRHHDERSVVVWAAGFVLPARRKPRKAGRVARLLARRPLYVEIAIEFVR